MKSPKEYPQIAKNILTSCIAVPQTYKMNISAKKDLQSYSNIACKFVFDQNSQNYLVIAYGYEPAVVTGNRSTFHPIRECIAHLEIADEIINIYQDKLEDSITNELLEAGIAEKQIVVFYPDKINHVKYVVNASKIYDRYHNYFITESNYQNPILKPNLTLAELNQLKKIDLEPINKAILLYEQKR